MTRVNMVQGRFNDREVRMQQAHCKSRKVAGARNKQDARLRTAGVAVDYTMLQIRARKVARDAGIPEACFKALVHWVNGFMKRHSLSLRSATRKGSATPNDGEVQHDAFSSKIQLLMDKHNVSVVYNADQTGVLFEYPVKRTITTKGIGAAWVKCASKDKMRLTAMILGSSDGLKYTPFVVAKAPLSKVPETRVENARSRRGFGPIVWAEIQEIEANSDVVIHGNPTAWWNKDLSIKVLRYHFAERLDMAKPIILLWDAFSGHRTGRVGAYARSINVELVEVPAGYTWRLQPADVAWVKPMKDRIRQYSRRQLEEQVLSDAANIRATYTRRNAIEWVAEAWAELPDSVIRCGFSKAAPWCRDVPVIGAVQRVDREDFVSNVAHCS